MPTRTARLVPFNALAALALVLVFAALGTAGAAGAAPTPPALDRAASDRAAADDAAAFAAALDRGERADAAVAELKRALKPGHLADPVSGLDQPFGLDALRDGYADMQRRAAGYRATLGDQHPTLVAAEQVLADLRGQLLTGLRTALAAAERDGAEARAAAGAAERRIAARSDAAAARLAAADRSDVTGAVPAVVPPRPLAPAVLSEPKDPAARDPATATAAAPAPLRPSPSALGAQLLGAAAMGSAALLAVWAALRLLAARRRALRPASRRVEPAVAVTGSRPGGDSVPVLASLALPAAASGLAAGGPASASELHDTLRAALGDPDRRITVLVCAAAGLGARDADAAGVTLALAAAAAGRRAVVMEARTDGRLRGALAAASAAAPAAVPMLVEAAGAARTLYRFQVGDLTVALLPSDAGEAEVAADAALRPDTPRLHGLDAFDTVILLGGADEALARCADVVLLAAPEGTGAEALATAAGPLWATGRTCGALLVTCAAEVPVAVAPPIPAPRPAPRRRLASDGVATARLGLRGTLEPARRRSGR